MLACCCLAQQLCSGWGVAQQSGPCDQTEGCTFLSRLSQKLAMSSAVVAPATDLLQKFSKASLRALWNRELLAKHSVTYCKHIGCDSPEHL